MKNFSSIVVFVAVLCAVLSAMYADEGDREFLVVEKTMIQKNLTFSNPSGVKMIDVDNVDGFIHVVGYDGSTVQLTVEKTTRALSREDGQQAQQEVELKISEKNNRIELFVDGPFRCKDGSMGRWSRHHEGYRVQFNFELKVPRESGLFLRTINHGDIVVENVEGKFDVENINGPIRMVEISGSGRVYALNGSVKVVFRKNPMGEFYFGSLNGNVDVAFLPNLSADLRFKTFNGSAYTDFPATALPNLAPVQEQQGGKYVYKSNRFFGARVGPGGPELKFDAFNGDIRITQR